VARTGGAVGKPAVLFAHEWMAGTALLQVNQLRQRSAPCSTHATMLALAGLDAAGRLQEDPGTSRVTSTRRQALARGRHRAPPTCSPRWW
jgi:hypothetical protein